VLHFKVEFGMIKPLNLFPFMIALPFMAWAQDSHLLMLRNGRLEMAPNAGQFAKSFKPRPGQFFEGRYHLVVQFETIPTQEARASMEREGIRLLDYLPYNAYIASMPTAYDLQKMVKNGVRSMMLPDDRVRLSPSLYHGTYPAWAVDGDKIEVMVMPYQDVPPATVAADLDTHFEVLTQYRHPRLVRLKVEINRLSDLLQFPYVQYIEPISAPPTKDDLPGRSLHRSNALNTDYAAGRHYDGTGVTVGLADDGIIGPHIDYQGRLTQFATTNTGYHGDMAGGILFGTGNREPIVRGHATGAYCYYWDIGTYTHILDAVDHYNSYGMILTSTSYSQGKGGVYTADAGFIDAQVHSNRQMVHVFSAGNEGTADHGYGAGEGWANITGGYKAAKGVITVGDMNSNGILESTSSRGPAEDGRIKPDICANGFGQMSTLENNATQTAKGTSAACPSVAGCVAQLYHAYKTLNGGSNPESALIKASILNTGDEAGNNGPDYQYGWGKINALRAVRVLEGNHYLKDSVTQGDIRIHTLDVPANTLELRVMVYWTDYPGNPSSARALVNDLNIQVTNGSTYNPWVLNPSPNATALNSPAQRGIDDLNNMEQVTVANPLAGNATVTVSGFAVPQGPQTYWLVYEFVQAGVEMAYPIGGEGFVPGEVEKLRWDASGATQDFTLQYSTNNGSSWTSITSTVPSTTRFYDWTVPEEVTGQALVRVSSSLFSDQSDAPFTIARLPSAITIDYICPDSIGISWADASGATSYEVSVLGSKYMDSITASTGTSAVIRNQNPLKDRWYSVRSLQGAGKGRRAIAIHHVGGIYNCPIPNDVAASQLLSPGSGSYLSCQDSTTVPVTLRVTNNGINPASSLEVGYRLDGSLMDMETIAGPLNPGAFIDHTFASMVRLGSESTHLLDAWVHIVNDANHYNDTLHQATTLVNIATGMNIPQTQDFELFPTCASTFDCGVTVCPLGSGWTNLANGIDDAIDWRVNTGTTESASTGPDADHSTGDSTGKYIYLEASDCLSKTAHLVSPCIDLHAASEPQLIFWYHMYGATMGELHVDVLSNGVWTLDARSPIIGDQGNAWHLADLNLTPYVGMVINVRFRGITGPGFTSDMALDDIRIMETQAPPVVNFVGAPKITCPNSTVTFTDNSSNSPKNWAWTITPGAFSYVGGTTANSRNPQVQFSVPGTYAVTLMANNSLGSDTLTRTNYIEIINGRTPPILEDFQGIFPPSGWTVLGPGQTGKWQQSRSITGSYGVPTLAAFVENFSYNRLNAEDKLLTFPVDLTSMTEVWLSWDLAYARFDAIGYESLRVEVSTDCGNTWPSVVYRKSDLALATVADQNGNWFPTTQSQWRNEQIDLTSFAGRQIMIRFVNVNGFGNNLYIDNVQLSNTVGLTSEIPTLSLEAWPNPADGLFNLSLQVPAFATTLMEVSDLAGRVIWRTRILASGDTWQGNLDLRALARGVYCLRVTSGGSQEVRRLVIE
jgi:PKD repeat protein